MRYVIRARNGWAGPVCCGEAETEQGAEEWLRTWAAFQPKPLPLWSVAERRNTGPSDGSPDVMVYRLRGGSRLPLCAEIVWDDVDDAFAEVR